MALQAIQRPHGAPYRTQERHALPPRAAEDGESNAICTSGEPVSPSCRLNLPMISRFMSLANATPSPPSHLGNSHAEILVDPSSHKKSDSRGAAGGTDLPAIDSLLFILTHPCAGSNERPCRHATTGFWASGSGFRVCQRSSAPQAPRLEARGPSVPPPQPEPAAQRRRLRRSDAQDLRPTKTSARHAAERPDEVQAASRTGLRRTAAGAPRPPADLGRTWGGRQC